MTDISIYINPSSLSEVILLPNSKVTRHLGSGVLSNKWFSALLDFNQRGKSIKDNSHNKAP